MVTAPAPAKSAPPASSVDEFGARSIFERISPTVAIRALDGGTEMVFHALGTRCRIFCAGPDVEVRGYFQAALQWVAAFEAKYSRFLPNSLISRIGAGAGGWIATDPETDRILAMCHEMHFLTRGVFDPTSLPLIKLWDWKRQPAELPRSDDIRRALDLIGWRKVERSPGRVRLPMAGMCLDLGGMGKEYAVDQVLVLSKQRGLTGALVDLGADVRVTGLPPDGRPGWHIGLDDPKNPGKCWTGLAVKEAAVATSGDYARRFEIQGKRYGHIIDVRTGYPVDNGCRAVSVLAPSCTLAGMLSTAAFVLGPQEGIRLIETQLGAAGAISGDQGRVASRRFYDYTTS
jgi:thiamine biosynthesis lipoprotein